MSEEPGAKSESPAVMGGRVGNVHAVQPSSETIQIAGAGPAGLAAAITLAQAGRAVVVHEMYRHVGYRFSRDTQGLENWTTKQDVLEVLQGLGMTTRFENVACYEGTIFDAWGQSYPVHSNKPLFYMIERGPGPGTLDTALLAQARALGVEVRFKSRLDRLEGPGILATGPKVADAIAVGYHFETSLPTGFWVICDNELAPQGYAYLVVLNGRGTLKSAMFSGYKQEKIFVERTVDAFRRLVGLEMIDPRPHGGVGNFRIPVSATSGRHPVVGEHAGFQDVLLGFGIRLAIVSGVLGARSLLDGGSYDARWRGELAPFLKSSLINRAIYGMMGNRGYRWLLRYQAGRSDPCDFMHWLYKPSWGKQILLPWARSRYESRRRDKSCDHTDCACIWCRCGKA